MLWSGLVAGAVSVLCSVLVSGAVSVLDAGPDAVLESVPVAGVFAVLGAGADAVLLAGVSSVLDAVPDAVSDAVLGSGKAGRGSISSSCTERRRFRPRIFCLRVSMVLESNRSSDFLGDTRQQLLFKEIGILFDGLQHFGVVQEPVDGEASDGCLAPDLGLEEQARELFLDCLNHGVVVLPAKVHETGQDAEDFQLRVRLLLRGLNGLHEPADGPVGEEGGLEQDDDAIRGGEGVQGLV